MVNTADAMMFSIGVLVVLFATLVRVMMSHPDSAVGLYWREGWFQPILFHRFWCKKHEWVVNYQSGWKSKLFCPLCDMETWRTAQNPSTKIQAVCGESWTEEELKNSIEQEDHNN
jgi:hypothetical protein